MYSYRIEITGNEGATQTVLPPHESKNPTAARTLLDAYEHLVKRGFIVTVHDDPDNRTWTDPLALTPSEKEPEDLDDFVWSALEGL